MVQSLEIGSSESFLGLYDFQVQGTYTGCCRHVGIKPQSPFVSRAEKQADKQNLAQLVRLSDNAVSAATSL